VSVTGGKIKFLPIDMAMLPYAEAQPDVVDCCWTTGASMGPQVSIALMDAVNARDWEAAKAIDADIKWATETFMPPDPAQFQFFNIQIEKLRMEGSGYCTPGPIRPPYTWCPTSTRSGPTVRPPLGRLAPPSTRRPEPPGEHMNHPKRWSRSTAELTRTSAAALDMSTTHLQR
jgi:hypothetical protein